MSSKGIDLKIQRDGLTICAGIASKDTALSAEPIDITSDDDNGWRAFLFESGLSTAEINFEGLAKESLVESLVVHENYLLTSVYLVWPDGAMLFGDFYLAGYQEVGEFQQAITFACVLLSVGVPVYVLDDGNVRWLENGEIRLLENNEKRLLE